MGQKGEKYIIVKIYKNIYNLAIDYITIYSGEFNLIRYTMTQCNIGFRVSYTFQYESMNTEMVSNLYSHKSQNAT